MRRGMLKLYSAITVTAMAISLSPVSPVIALGGSNEVSLVTATTDGSLGATLECGGVDLITATEPTITYGDQLICDLNWAFPDNFTLTTEDILVYNLPEVISFEQKTGDIMDGNKDIGDYEIVGNQIRLNYTDPDFCAEESRQGHLAFSGSVERNPDGTTDPADIPFSFEGIADITVHVEPPVSGAYLTVDKVFQVVDEEEHIYNCRIPITATGSQTGIVVRDTMWPGMELYGGFPVIYSDSGYTTEFTDHTEFAFEEGDGRTFSCTINHLANNQTVYMIYQVKVDDAMYNNAAGNALVEAGGYTGDNNYYPDGYEGTIPNRVTVTSNEAQQAATKTTEIYGSGYSFVKWYARPVGTELDRGHLRWQLYINKINDSSVTSGYIVDTIPANNSFDADSVMVYSGDDYHGYNVIEQVNITTETVGGVTQVRFEFTDDMITNLKTVANGIYIEYTTHVDSQTADTERYINTANLYYNGELNSTRTADTYYTKPAEVEKSGIYNATTAPAAHYTIEVNPAAMDLDPNSNVVVLTDTMGSALDLDTSSVRVNGVAPSADSLTYDPATHTFRLTLQDETAYIVTYNAIVNLVPGATLDDTNAVNTCSLSGVATNGGDGAYTLYSRVYDNSASSSSVIGRATLNIIKHDSASTADLLSGAAFTVSEATIDANGNVTATTAYTTGTTDASGRISVNDLTRGTCYMIVETSAPSGYELDSTPRFVIFSDSASATYPSTVTYNGTTYSVEVISNTRASFDLYIGNAAEQPQEPEPTEPTETSETTEPTETSETTAPTETSETTQPTETSETSAPTETSETTQPTETSETTVPTETSETTQPTETSETTVPTETSETTQPTESSETSAPSETTVPSETTAPSESSEATETAAPSETTAAPSETDPSVDAVVATTTTSETTAAPATTPSVDAAVATTTTAPAATTTTAAPTTAATTTAPSASVLGAARDTDPTTDPSESSEETTAAPTATPTPTPATSGSTVASTGEAASHTVLIGNTVIAAAALCFVFYVRKEKKHS